MTASWARMNTVSSTLFDARSQRGKPVRNDLRRERAVGVGEHPGVDLRPPVEQQGGDDTRKIPSRTSQAAPVCEPENRESRPSRLGSCRSRMTANVMMPEPVRRPRTGPR